MNISDVNLVMNKRAYLLLVGVMLVVSSISIGQDLTKERESQRKEFEENYSLVERLYANDRSVVPKLRELFESAKEETDKARIAIALLSCGVSDDKYFEYLLGLVLPIINSDQPSPVVYDEKGYMTPHTISPEFEKWCKKNNLNCVQEAQEATIWHGKRLRVAYLALATDPRAFPYLVKAVQLGNPFIAFEASIGLGRLQDKRAIPILIEACSKAPAFLAFTIAQGLAFFPDDIMADNAIEKCIPDKELAKMARLSGSIYIARKKKEEQPQIVK